MSYKTINYGYGLESKELSEILDNAIVIPVEEARAYLNSSTSSKERVSILERNSLLK